MSPDDVGTILRAVGRLEGKMDSLEKKVDDVTNTDRRRLEHHDMRITALEQTTLTAGRLSWWDVLKLVTAGTGVATSIAIVWNLAQN